MPSSAITVAYPLFGPQSDGSSHFPSTQFNHAEHFLPTRHVCPRILQLFVETTDRLSIRSLRRITDDPRSIPGLSACIAIVLAFVGGRPI